MKLHLPKALFTAVMALFAVSQTAYALTVDIERSISYDSFATDGSATTMPEGVTYDASSGVLTGIASSEVWFKLNTDALTAENAGGHVIYVTATNDDGASCSWGINTDAAGTGLAGYWSPSESESNPSGTWTSVTVSAEKLDELNGDSSEIILKGNITATNSGTHLYDVNGNDIYNAGSLKTTSYGSVDVLTLNNQYVSSILYNVETAIERVTISNADGSFARTYSGSEVAIQSLSDTPVEATLINNGALQVTGKTDGVTKIVNGGDIIIGGSGNLFLQTWNGNNNVTDADILIENDLYIGSTGNGYGALRTADYCGDVIINGDITLIEDALFTKEEQPASGERGTDTIINGKLSGDYTLSVKSSSAGKNFDDIEFAGEIDLKGLTIAENGAGGANFTISGQTAIDTLTVSADTVLTKEGDARMTYGEVLLNQTLELAGSGTISVTGTVKGQNSDKAELIIGEDIILEANLMHAAWGMRNITVNGLLDVDELRISTDKTTTNINGSGTIKADVIAMGNAGTYNFEDIRIEVGSGGMTTNNTNADTMYLGDVTFAATDSSWSMNAAHNFSLVDTETGTTFEVAAEKTITINSVISNKVETVTEGEGEEAIQTEVVTAGKLVKTGAGTLLLNGNNTYTGDTIVKAGALEIAADKTLGNTAITVDANSSVVLNAGSYNNSISGEGSLVKKGTGIVTLSNARTYTGGTSIEGGTLITNATGALGSGPVDVKNGSTLDFAHQGHEEGISAINLSGGSNLIVRSGYWAQCFTSDILIDGDNTITSGYGGNGGSFNGAITGAGALSLQQCIWNGNPTSDTWSINSIVTDKSATEKLSIESSANVTMAGANTYSGGTVVKAQTMQTNNIAALGTGKVTVDGGTLKQISALKVSELEYKSGTVNNAGSNLEIGSLTVGATKMEMKGAGATTVTNTLTVNNTDAFSMEGALVLTGATVDLSGFTVDTTTAADTYVYTLGTAAGGITADETISFTGLNVDNYTAALVAMTTDPTANAVMLLDGAATNNYLVLTLTKNAPDTPDVPALTQLTVTGAQGYADGVLTLTTAENAADAVFGSTLDATMTDAVWDTIVGTYDLDDEIAISFVGADGQTFDFNGADDSLTAPTITINGDVGVGEGATVGADGTVVGNYVTAYIPEPTTTTLSLLALAAMAVRRRRK